MTKRSPDFQTKAMLNELAAEGGPPVFELSPAEARASRNPFFEALGGAPPEVARVENRNIPGPSKDIPIRIYEPLKDDGIKDPLPVLVYFHGGGWLLGSLETHDSLCRKLANRSACIVVSVDYRLAPENPFPAAVEDAYAAVCWAVQNAESFNGEPSQTAVGGDSAGGNLAAVCSLLARDQNGPVLSHQLLLYPVLDLSSFDTPSYREHATGYLLTAESMLYYRDQYLKDEKDRKHPYASPLLAEDFSGLPSATVVTAEFDVLTDEAKAYADKLEMAGVPVLYLCYEEMIHPFLNFLSRVDRAREAVDEIGKLLGQKLRD